MKKIFLALAFIFFSLPVLKAQDSRESMQDAFARGFQAVKEKNRESAIDWFNKAGQFAIEIGEWKGCLDSGNALLKLGEAAASSSLFENALAVGERNTDWRILVASGYALASLPPELNQKPKAEQAFLFAAQYSKQKGDWMGITEAANGLHLLGNQPSAVEALNEARAIIESSKSVRGSQVLAQMYERVGLPNESKQMKLAKEEFSRVQGHAQSPIPPPPGWNPVGESIAGSWMPSPEQQRMARQGADQDIAHKNQWILNQNQIELEKEKMAQTYSSYYYYPYGYASYASYEPWGWDQLIPWADYCSDSYVYTDGYYHYSGEYTGFGFAYGYSDGDSYFGVSVQVYD